MAIYHGYAVLISTFFCRGVGMGLYYSGGLFIIPLMVTFGIGEGFAASYIAIYSSVASISSFISGFLQDKLAARGYTSRLVFAAGAILICVGTTGASYSKSFPIFLSCTVLVGIGLGFTGFSAPCIMSLWFEKKRVQFLMIAMSGGGVGSFAYSNIIVQMLGAFHDKGAAECRIGVNDPSACNEWRPTLRYIGLLSALILFIASLFMRAPKIKEVENYENQA